MSVKAVGRRFPNDRFVLRAVEQLREFELHAELDVTVPGGAVIGLIGPSGAGKSTVLRFAAGLMPARSGFLAVGDRVWFDSARGVDVPTEQREIGYMPQNGNLFPHLSALRNVEFAVPRSLPRKSRRTLALDLLQQVGADRLADAYPTTLSGGERSRIALARALARRPSLLLLDEPFSGIDGGAADGLREALSEASSAAGMVTVIVSHSVDDVAAMCDVVVSMEVGKIVDVASAPSRKVRMLRSLGQSVVAAVPESAR